jgi:hypothetical protein
MARLLAFLFVLSAGFSFAQDGVTRGDALRRREYQTYSAVTLFVDPTGADTNACTASGTAACATVTGALSKLPLQVRNNVTINVAAGTYTDTFDVTGFQFVGDGLTFTILGTQVNFTPATGAATGTITAFADQPDTAASRGVLTDSGQTWTVNNLRGRLLEITSGAASGQVRPIAENTATTVTFAGAFATDPAPGATYRISTPGPVWSSGGLRALGGLNGRATVRVESLAQVGGITVGENQVTSLQLAGMYVAAAATALQVQASRLTLSSTPPNFFEGGTGPGINLLTAAASPWCQLAVGTVLVRTNATNTGAFTSSGAPCAVLGLGGSTLYAQAPNFNSSPSGLVRLEGADVNFPPSARSAVIVDCGSVASSVGIRYNATNSVLHRRVRFDSTYSLFLNCTTAVQVGGGQYFNIQQPGHFLTYSGVTNEWLIDGTPYTQAFIQSLSPALVATPRATVVTYALP